MQPLKIAVIVKYFPTISETFIVNQVNSLIEGGHQVKLFSYNKNAVQGIHESILKHNLLKSTIYFNKPSILKIRRFLMLLKWVLKHLFKMDWRLFFKVLNVFKFGREAATLKLYFEAQWFLIHTDFDIIHVHFGQNAKRLAYLKALDLLPQKAKLITTFHGYDLMPNNANFYKKDYKELRNQSNAFTVNTKYLQNLLLECFPDLQNVFILPVGLDTNFFVNHSVEKDTQFFDIVFCGRLIPFKGPDIAIEVIRKLHEIGYNKTRLHIIGNGKMRNKLQKKIEVLKLEKYATIYGSLTQEQIKEQLNKGDAFLLPGRRDPNTGRVETQGLVIQEAQSMNLPVIVSDVGGMKYGLIPDETGFVVKENDVQGFVNAIEKLILNPELKTLMGNKGRVFVGKNYDNKVLAKKLITIYEELI